MDINVYCCPRADEDEEYANRIVKEEMRIQKNEEILNEEDVELAKKIHREEMEQQRLQQQRR